MKDAVRQSGEGIILDLEVSPGAREAGMVSYNPWRKRIEIRLSERAEKGRANAELISFLSDLFEINSENVRIIKGLKSSKKSVIITGRKSQDILKLLLENEHKKS
ncbi:MAG TPA: DUF167 domain-containing protein [Candidatus Methanoperedens sp.]